MMLAERFWIKVDKSGPCWLWLAARNAYGYGHIKVDGRMQYAHRIAYQMQSGPIPPGMDLDHLCRVRLCVNPAHLEPVSRGENVRRGEGLSAQRSRQTHCKRGHLLDEVNTYVWRTSRICRTCKRERPRAQPPS